MNIRKATKDDAELIHSLAVEVFPATYKEILSAQQIDYMMEWMYSVSNILKQMEEGHIYFLACSDLNIEDNMRNDQEYTDYLGYASVEQQDENTFHLQKIYVLPRCQGKKVGAALFDKAITYIKSVHPTPCVMELNVNRNNKALGFYKKRGMTIVSQGDFPIGNGYYMNDYIMQLSIK